MTACLLPQVSNVQTTVEVHYNVAHLMGIWDVHICIKMLHSNIWYFEVYTSLLNVQSSILKISMNLKFDSDLPLRVGKENQQTGMEVHFI